MYQHHKYEKSLLHEAITNFIQSLDDLKKMVKNDKISITDTESKYLEQFHQLWCSLHNKLLPIYSQGRGPSLSNALAAKEFSDEVNKFKLKKTIETPLDLELAKRLQEFMNRLLNQNLMEIAPFFDIEKIDVTVWGINVGEKIRKQMRKLGLDDLLLPDQFKTNFSKKYVALSAVIDPHRETNTEKSSTIDENKSLCAMPRLMELQSSANDITPTKVANIIEKRKQFKKTSSANIKGLTTIFKSILIKSRLIAQIGRHKSNYELIHLSKALRQQVNDFNRKYKNKRIKLTIDDCTKFKDDIHHIINRIDKQMATMKEYHKNSLWDEFQPILDLFVNLVQYIISPIIDISINRNSLFIAPEPKIIEDLRTAVSEIPEAGLC